MSDNDYGNTQKKFPVWQYVGSHGVRAKQPRKRKGWEEYVPKYVEDGEYTEPKKTGAYSKKLSAEIEDYLKRLETSSYIEIAVGDVDKFMKRISEACRRRGIRLKFSRSSIDGKVFIRK